jgi:DNA invertase Pin-like site-specific DNA recombinase
VRDLITMLDELRERGVRFQSVAEAIGIGTTVAPR